MKKNLLTSLSILAGLSASAQLPVSTTVDTRNVIIEEYTGIHCTYCPAGHKDANLLIANNPGDVFAINIHEGSYAVPSGNEPDFRTTWGPALESASNISGYPAADINRLGDVYLSGTPLAFGPLTDFNNVLGQDSYVNVAFDASVDAQTRELTVDLEAYFTGVAPSSVYINVVLLQDSIAGPQTAGTTYYPSNFVNGEYMHNHVLRHMLTGQWGEVISTTTTGTLFSDQYTYTLPFDIAGVGLEMPNLTVVAYISTGTGGGSEIITGVGGDVDLVIPAGVSSADVGAISNMSVPSDYCQTNVVPQVTITNNGAAVVDTFALSYDLNGGTPVVENFYNTQPLSPGASYTHSFPSVNIVSGANIINYSINSNEDLTTIDLVSGNNALSSSEFYLASLTSVGETLQEGFEGASIGNGFEQDANDIAFEVDQSASGSVTWDLGAYEASSASYMWYFYNASSGEKSSIVFDKLDFSTHTGNAVIFSHAYAQYQTYSDRLKIYVSINCGATWTAVYNKAGSQLSTAASTTDNFFPRSADWTTTEVDLSTYDGQAEVMVKFEGTSNYGNNLYVDDINITWPTEISELEMSTLSVYPNPASDFVNIELNVNAEDMVLEVYNSIGELVLIEKNLNIGMSKVVLNTSDYTNGIYIVNLRGENVMYSKRIAILK